MSATIWVSSCIQSLQRRREPFDITPPPLRFLNRLSSSYIRIRTAPLLANSSILPNKFHVICSRITSPGASSVDDLTQDLDLPISIQLQSIVTEAQFDEIISETQQPYDAVIILWKCIYLKPKLEKLAAEYQPRFGLLPLLINKIRFYSVDVNKVPHRLVSRAGVTKMPTIQLWKDAKKQAEVIGGHKAYLVVNEIREMIEDECSV
ncbi:thioredoxin-like 3-2, chloroplastic isoform X2 [Telopea speciosissima]|uniref:thioredoxin-like 3-2, chloroplastic isoform X2 n=1 Tax=Telopea speciosissima TaxID=54955 RepID=UPI001CC73789|nr:thioredoxin-like 3-2, chloroplastic isoform X2 [Telopea speciosissima]